MGQYLRLFSALGGLEWPTCEAQLKAGSRWAQKTPRAGLHPPESLRRCFCKVIKSCAFQVSLPLAILSFPLTSPQPPQGLALKGPNGNPRTWSNSVEMSSLIGWYSSCSVHFSSVAQSRPTLCNPMTHSTPGLPVHHQLPELTQTHVHRVGDIIQRSLPLSSPSPPAPNSSQN